jgi:hypothetical protein
MVELCNSQIETGFTGESLRDTSAKRKGVGLPGAGSVIATTNI